MTIPQASLLAVQSLGIIKPAGFDGTFATFGTLDVEDRIRVTRWVRNYVEDNPTQFSTAEVAVAERFEDVGGPVDESFDYDLFWSEVRENAYDLIGKPLVDAGKAASLVATVLPLIVIAAGIYFLLLNKSKLKL